jgi:hypothetical protein
MDEVLGSAVPVLNQIARLAPGVAKATQFAAYTLPAAFTIFQAAGLAHTFLVGDPAIVYIKAQVSRSADALESMSSSIESISQTLSTAFDQVRLQLMTVSCSACQSHSFTQREFGHKVYYDLRAHSRMKVGTLLPVLLVFNPGSTWHSHTEALLEEKPLPKALVYKFFTDFEALFSYAFLLCARDVIEPHREIHILLPSAHTYVIPAPFVIPAAIAPVIIAGDLNREGKPFVWLQKNVGHIKTSDIRHIGLLPGPPLLEDTVKPVGLSPTMIKFGTTLAIQVGVAITSDRGFGTAMLDFGILATTSAAGYMYGSLLEDVVKPVYLSPMVITYGTSLTATSCYAGLCGHSIIRGAITGAMTTIGSMAVSFLALRFSKSTQGLVCMLLVFLDDMPAHRSHHNTVICR